MFHLMKTFTERARYADGWTKKADAMEKRWRRYADSEPPPAHVADQQIKIRIRGGDSAGLHWLSSDLASAISSGRSRRRSTSANASPWSARTAAARRS